jgi:hypothetical protein
MSATDEQTTADAQDGYAGAAIKRVTAENGIEYAYRELGAGEVPLVLLQHFRGNLDNWDPALTRSDWSSRSTTLESGGRPA